VKERCTHRAPAHVGVNSCHRHAGSLCQANDIFPYIDIPVVSVVWTFTGISPDEMEKRIVTVSERAMTTAVNDIEHIESQSYNGVAVIKVYFQPDAKVEMAISPNHRRRPNDSAGFTAGHFSAQHSQI
jgi:hypothetical protein